MRNYSKIAGKKGFLGYRTQSSFTSMVLHVVSSIPKGKTLSYMEVAKKAGSPKAFRAVGNIISKNYDPKIPCHRVIRADGKIGCYNRGVEEKVKILKQEGAI